MGCGERLWRHEGRAHVQGRVHDGVGCCLDAGQHLDVKVRAVQVDRARRRAKVKSYGLSVTCPDERLRQDVLAGVLLHVIEPPRPVQDAGDFIRGQGRRQDVPGEAVLGDNVEDGDVRTSAPAPSSTRAAEKSSPAGSSLPVSCGCPPPVG